MTPQQLVRNSKSWEDFEARVAKQRTAYKKNKLSEEQVNNLKSIGIQLKPTKKKGFIFFYD